MNPDLSTIEQLIEVITREVLVAIAEQQAQAAIPEGERCQFDCAEGTCVRTCYDRAGKVVSAGAERLSSTIGVIPQDMSLARLIDHTLLKPDASPDQIAQLCFEARKYGFASVCVNPAWVELCAQLLKGTTVKVCSVIGFPLGASPSEVKVFETQNAIDHGANEIDMVINIGGLKARDLELVAKDIRGVVNAAHARNVIVKVIIEAVLLTDEEKTIACLLSKETGADFVKTSTGFARGGATVHDVALMRRVVGPEMGVKAAGGIHTFEDAESMIKAGATRIGASAGVKILQGPGAQKPASASPAASGKSY
jgi:deoxyribose-phosphate aldolase